MLRLWLFTSISLFILFLPGCSPRLIHEEFSLEGEAFVRPIPDFESELPESCLAVKEESIEVKIPEPLNRYPELKDFPFVEYCIDVEDTHLISQPLLYLGYIDQYYRVFWNGNLVQTSIAYEEEGIEAIYDSQVIVRLRSKELKPRNQLVLRVKKSTDFEERGGIYTGHPALLPEKEFRKEEVIKQAYDYSRVVLFFASSLLFIVIFAGKLKNPEFFWFGLYLFAEGIYFTTQLQIQNYLEWNLNHWKRAEYVFLTLQNPLFGAFLFSILGRSVSSRWILAVYFIELGFAIFFASVPDIETIYAVNQLYHLPFMVGCIALYTIVLLKEYWLKNPKALPLINILALPGLIALVEILNVRFSLFPILSEYKIAGDSVTLMILFMGMYLSYEFYRMESDLSRTILKEEHLRKTFQLYVPPQDLEKILGSVGESNQGGPQAELIERIILFCDMRNFTQITENLSPMDTVHFLNSYFEVFSDIIIRHNGVIDKLIGDCIMARFPEEDAPLALQASILMQTELIPFNRKRKELGLPVIQHGIGLAMGKVVEGNIGSTNKMDYTVIGDSVNLASRLENLTKFYSVSILVSENIVKKTEFRFPFREIDTIRVLGQSNPVKVFEPLLLYLPDNVLKTTHGVTD